MDIRQNMTTGVYIVVFLLFHLFNLMTSFVIQFHMLVSNL